MLDRRTYSQPRYSGFEPLDAFDVIYRGHFEHRLLRAGHASLDVQRLAIGDVRIESGAYDFPVIAQGTMPDDAICIGFVADGSEATRYNTATIDRDEIQVYSPGVELLYYAARSSRWVCLTASEDLLQGVAYARTGRHLDLPGRQRAIAAVSLARGDRQRLTHVVDYAMILSKTMQRSGEISSRCAEEISGELLASYIDALHSAVAIDGDIRSGTAERHHQVIVACERLITTGQEPEIALAEVARRSGYSLRSLELIFRRSVDMTPGRWFLNVRLNAALRDLLNADAKTTVHAIATKWGFRHMPRFAAQYARSFGELPSETLQRSRMKA